MLMLLASYFSGWLARFYDLFIKISLNILFYFDFKEFLESNVSSNNTQVDNLARWGDDGYTHVSIAHSLYLRMKFFKKTKTRCSNTGYIEKYTPNKYCLGNVHLHPEKFFIPVERILWQTFRFLQRTFCWLNIKRIYPKSMFLYSKWNFVSRK